MRIVILLAGALLAACSDSGGPAGGSLPQQSTTAQTTGQTAASSSGTQSSTRRSSGSGTGSSSGSVSESASQSSSGSTASDGGEPIDGGVTASGTINGQNVIAGSVVSFVSNGMLLEMEITDDVDFSCAIALMTVNGTGFASVNAVKLTIFSNAQLGPGTYSVNPDGGSVGSGTTSVGAEYVQADSACVATTVNATTGTLTITTLDAASIAGSYHFGFGSSGSVDGDFNTPLCQTSGGMPGPSAEGGPVCEPRP